MDIRILVVDDDQDSVELVEKILKKDGYRVVSLTDGRKVDEEIRKNEIHLAVAVRHRRNRCKIHRIPPG